MLVPSQFNTLSASLAAFSSSAQLTDTQTSQSIATLQASLGATSNAFNFVKVTNPTNFVLVSEFMDEDGIYWSAIYKDDNLPPWRHVGLLYHALENGFNEGEDEDERELQVLEHHHEARDREVVDIGGMQWKRDVGRGRLRRGGDGAAGRGGAVGNARAVRQVDCRGSGKVGESGRALGREN